MNPPVDDPRRDGASTITVDLVYFDAGGGHRAAALALQAALRLTRPRWRVRLVDLMALLDPQAHVKRLTGLAPVDFYNRRLATGFTLGLETELKLLQAGIAWCHGPLVRTLARHWIATAPDLVVSLIPNFNRALADSVQQAGVGRPLVTVMTDLADLPPHFWAEPGAAQHLVCGTPRALAQARAAGCDPARLHLTSGMPLHPDFDAPRPPREAWRRELGLPVGPGAPPVGVVMFGGHGSRAMLRIARALPAVPLVLLCGRNERLAEWLRAEPSPAPRVVVGYTREVARWLSLGDFFIGKPGPGSLSEALHMGLPVIVPSNAWTLPQERYNTRWVQEQGVGLVIERWRDIAAAVATLQARLPALRAAVWRQDNRAVWELPDILDDVLREPVARRRSAGAPAHAFTPALAAGTIPAQG